MSQKEPFVEFITARTSANLTISGHMGAPTTMVWNPFGVMTVEEALTRLHLGLDSVKAACLEAALEESVRVKEEFGLIEKLPQDEIKLKRGGKVPRWYREMTHVNLPDGDRGYSVLDIKGGGWSLSSSYPSV